MRNLIQINKMVVRNNYVSGLCLYRVEATATRYVGFYPITTSASVSDEWLLRKFSV